MSFRKAENDGRLPRGDSMLDSRHPSAPLSLAYREAANPETARDVLGRHLPGRNRIRAARIVKVWSKPDGIFVLLYETTDDTGAAWATAFLFPPGHNRTLRTPPARATFIPEWNAYVQSFPNDYKMRHLRTAAVASRARGIIASALESAGPEWRGFYLQSVKPCSYWPSRKCLLRYKGSIGDNPPAQFYVKLFFDETAKSLLHLHKALRSAGLDGRRGLEVPAPIGHCQPFKAVLFARARGSTLLELLNSPNAELASASAGRLLGGFHGVATDLQLPVHGSAEEIRVLQRCVRAVESIRAQDMGQVKRLLGRLKTIPAAADLPYITGHGDFYDKQVLFDGKVATLLDLDMACRAHAERDAGNFLAHLELRGLENGGRADQYLRMAQPFAAAYESCRSRWSERALRWYLASAFLRLACRAATQPAEAGLFAPLVGLGEREVERL